MPFLILGKKFGEDDAMHEYMERFVKVTLSMFMHIESKQDDRAMDGHEALDPCAYTTYVNHRNNSKACQSTCR